MASPEPVSGDPRAQVLPFATAAGGTDFTSGKGFPEPRDTVRVQHQGAAVRKLGGQNRSDRCCGLIVPSAHAVIVAMAIFLRQHRLADVIRPEDEPDVFAGRQPGDDVAVVGDKPRRISLAEKGQHAEQVMRADRNGHALLMSAMGAEPKREAIKLCFPGDIHLKAREFAVFAG